MDGGRPIRCCPILTHYARIAQNQHPPPSRRMRPIPLFFLRRHSQYASRSDVCLQTYLALHPTPEGLRRRLRLTMPLLQMEVRVGGMWRAGCAASPVSAVRCFAFPCARLRATPCIMATPVSPSFPRS